MAYLFERKGLVTVKREGCDADALMEVAVEAGADDIVEQGDVFEITCSTDVYSSVVEALEAGSFPIQVKEVARIPSNTVEEVDDDTAKSILKLLEQLEDHDDVQSVASNVNLSAAQLEAAAS